MMMKDPKRSFGQHTFETEEEKREHLKTVSIHALFHMLWARSGTDFYDKAEWMELEKRLREQDMMKP